MFKLIETVIFWTKGGLYLRGLPGDTSFSILLSDLSCSANQIQSNAMDCNGSQWVMKGHNGSSSDPLAQAITGTKAEMNADMAMKQAGFAVC